MASGSENDMKRRPGEDKGNLLPETLEFDVTIPTTGLHSFQLDLALDEAIRLDRRKDRKDRFSDGRSVGKWRGKDRGKIDSADEQLHVRIECTFKEIRSYGRKVAKLHNPPEECVRIVALTLADISPCLPNLSPKLVYQTISPPGEMYDPESQQYSPQTEAFLDRMFSEYDGYTAKNTYANELQRIEVDVDRERADEFRRFASDEGRDVNLIGHAWYEPPTDDPQEDFLRISPADE